MAQNRYLSYGYKIVNGKIKVDITEGEVITLIYTRYADGWSYKKIAEKLTAEGKQYTESKPVWNKNMVARILQNEKYIGTDKYPQIVDEVTFEKAKKSMKPYNHTQLSGIKDIKPLLVCECGQPLGRRIKSDGKERWYCPEDIAHISTSLTDESIIKQVAELQKLMASVKAPKRKNEETSIEIIRLQNEIEYLLEQPNPDIQAIKEMVMSLATEKYNVLCTQSNYIDSHMIKKLSESNSVKAKTLKQITTSIVAKGSTVTALILKNNMKIMKGANQ